MIIDHHSRRQDMKYQCIYCKDELDGNWVSENIHHFHYKTAICKRCGRENRIKVNFIGSGNDDWQDGKWISVEELEKLKAEFEKLIDEFKLNSIRR